MNQTEPRLGGYWPQQKAKASLALLCTPILNALLSVAVTGGGAFLFAFYISWQSCFGEACVWSAYDVPLTSDALAIKLANLLEDPHVRQIKIERAS